MKLKELIILMKLPFFYESICAQQWRIRNIFLLRSPLYIVGNCPRYTVENAIEKYSGYTTGAQ
jgi:hypothetical protein